VEHVSDRVAVMYVGEMVEMAETVELYSQPKHPYTEALLSAVPTVDGGERERIKLEGDIPSAANPPTGCVFHTRCPRRLGTICDETEPPLVEVEENHLMRCHIPLDELRTLQAAGPPPVSAAPAS
jgi:peptide/nickel transport system ATP-binding protein